MNFNSPIDLFNPLSCFPQGGNVLLLLPPWGKDGKGVKSIKTEDLVILISGV
jgi:hypothetical protein